jgi:hypothetical protein
MPGTAQCPLRTPKPPPQLEAIELRTNAVITIFFGVEFYTP